MASNAFERTGERRGHTVRAVALCARADGSLENVEINRTSRNPAIDSFAARMVSSAAPYEPFTPDLCGVVDVLHITRTWSIGPAK